MKSILRALALAGLLFPFFLIAADHLAEGTVKKIDLPNQGVMLAHGPIKHLGMGAMTMLFKVKDGAMLRHIQEGDRVRFRVESGNGSYVIVHIEAVR